MNSRQRKALVSAAVVILLMLIYPPFDSEYKGLGGTYAFILDPPERYTIDASALLIQWLGVLLIAAIAFLTLKDPS